MLVVSAPSSCISLHVDTAMNMNQVTLPVVDMNAATAFYLRMGFTQIVDTAHYARFECPEGGATFSLSLESPGFSNGATIYFEHEALDTLVADLQAKGFVFDQGLTDMSYLWRGTAAGGDPARPLREQGQALLGG